MSSSSTSDASAADAHFSLLGRDRWSIFFRRAAIANWGLGALLRFTSGPILQLVALQIFALNVQQFLVLTVVLGLVSFCQLAGLALYYRRGPFEALLLCYRARTFLLLVLASAPFFLSISHDLAVWMWATLVVGLNAIHSVGFAVSWPPIVRAGTSQLNRGRVTSRLRAFQTVVAASLAVVIAMLGPSRFDAVAFAGLALFFAAFSLGASRQIEWMRVNVQAERPGSSGNIKQQLVEDIRFLFGDRNAKRFLCVVIVFGLIGLPLQVFYLDGLLRFPRSQIFWFLAVSTIVGIVSMLAWGAIIDRRGGVFAARLCLLAVIAGLLAQVVLLVIQPTVRGDPAAGVSVLLSMLVVNIGTQGIALLWFNEALKVLPQRSTTAGVMLFGFAYECSGAAAGFVAGSIWSYSSKEPVGLMPFISFLSAVCLLAVVTLVAIGRIGVFRPAQSAN